MIRTRLHRLIAILLLLESRGQIKAAELAAALETSPRTIYRDVDALCQAGVPLTATTGPNGGIRFMPGYHAALSYLKGEDAVNLYLSGIGREDGTTAPGLRQALDQLENLLPGEYARDIRAARERFYFDDTPWWGDHRAPPHLPQVRQAVLRGRKLRVAYARPGGQAVDRVLLPYGLAVKAMQWYLVAASEGSEEPRTYKVERITDAQVLPETFERPPGFDLEAHWKRSVQAFRAERRAAEQYPVGLRLRREHEARLQSLEVYTVQRLGEWVTAEVNMHSFELAHCEALEAAWWAEVLSPQELRAHVGQQLLALAGVYRVCP